MSRKNRPSKYTNKQIRNKQVTLVLRELEKNIETFRLTIEKKEEQLQKFSRILKRLKPNIKKYIKKI